MIIKINNLRVFDNREQGQNVKPPAHLAATLFGDLVKTRILKRKSDGTDAPARHVEKE